jgi:hypothetical protein
VPKPLGARGTRSPSDHFRVRNRRRRRFHGSPCSPWVRS